MKFLVTGSSGFIGTALVHYLSTEGHEILGVDRRPPRIIDPSVKSVECDILDLKRLTETLENFKPEVVIHLAARTSLKNVGPNEPRYEANTLGTQNLMTAIQHCPSVRRAIYTSTKYVYRGGIPQSSQEYHTDSSYGHSKAEMEKLIRSQDGGCPEWCIVRPTTVWGPEMGKHYIGFLRMIQKGRYFHVGNNLARKHLAFVGNIVYQYFKLSQVPADLINREVFYLADYEPAVIKDWANALAKKLNAKPIPTLPAWIARSCALVGDVLAKCIWRKFPFTSFRLNNITKDDICDVSCTRKVCGELPYSFDQAVEKTAEWYFSLKLDN